MNRFWSSKQKKEIILGNKIGQGSFGAVYICEYKGETRAAKVINTSKKTEKDLKLLENEIMIWSTMSHQNIISMFFVFKCKEKCTIICELLMGGNLKERHARMNRLGTKPRILTIVQGLCQIVSGMTYIHDKRILHRDLKSENILLSANHETYKIGDFGLARTAQGDDKTAETGSYRHMAPEVIRHERYNTACDVYSFSMLMYEMLTLSVPFSHYSAVDAAMAVAVRSERPPLPPLPEDVLKLLTDCWQQTPEYRPSFSTVLERLQVLKEKKSSFGSLQMARQMI